ncbi:MAG: hypothetical protein JWQ33_2441 [Ramlibacter sp.]|nr:hypothetical protein [Ramlibacter sp.]
MSEPVFPAPPGPDPQPPGRRNGRGSKSILPYLVQLLAAKPQVAESQSEEAAREYLDTQFPDLGE